LGTVASSVASVLHASHAGMLAVWMARRNLSIAGADDCDMVPS